MSGNLAVQSGGGDPRVALVLFVKDEYEEILYWVAWHLSIGCDTIFIFDDGSTDGTVDAVMAASRAYDVRLIRVTPSSDFFVVRQQRAYEYILREKTNEFDWIGFLDADEYIHINDTGHIKEFLSRFPHADAVAINWCNFGSNDLVVRPPAPPMFAYKRHSPREDFWNQHVKSFVRPGAIERRSIDVHRFAADDARYVRPNGEVVRWHNRGGVTDDHAQWTVARILHYRSRSLEHFVGRVRKREDQSNIRPQDFSKFDSNQEVSDCVFLNESRFFEILEKLAGAYGRELVNRVTTDSFRNRVEALRNVTQDAPKTMELVGSEASTAYYRSTGWISELRDKRPVGRVPVEGWREGKLFRFYNLLTHWETYLSLDPRTGQLCHVRLQPGSSTGSRIILARSEALPAMAFLCLLDLEKPLLAAGDPRVTKFLGMVIHDFEGERRVALSHPASSKYLVAFEPGSDGTSGSISIDRWRASAWETFQLEDIPAGDLEKLERHQQIQEIVKDLANFAALKIDIRSISSWATDLSDNSRTYAFPIAIGTMPEEERVLFDTALAARIPALI